MVSRCKSLCLSISKIISLSSIYFQLLSKSNNTYKLQVNSRAYKITTIISSLAVKKSLRTKNKSNQTSKDAIAASRTPTATATALIPTANPSLGLELVGLDVSVTKIFTPGGAFDAEDTHQSRNQLVRS